RPRKNTIVATMQSRTTPCIRRRAMKRFMTRLSCGWRSLLPGLLLRARNALEHVAELVPAGDRVELSDQLGIDGVVAHALDDRDDHPRSGDKLDHAVGQGRAFGQIELGQQRPVDLDEVLAGLRAILLVTQQTLRAVWRERGVIAPLRVGAARRTVHR